MGCWYDLPVSPFSREKFDFFVGSFEFYSDNVLHPVNPMDIHVLVDAFCSYSYTMNVVFTRNSLILHVLTTESLG
jgi:hypothetical protein